MKPLEHRDPLAVGPRSFARWLNGLRNQSGAYVIRDKRTHEILYVGESHSGRLASTIKRHLYPWKDTQDRRHVSLDPRRVEIAVRITPPTTAVAAQNNLIARRDPRENRQGKEEEPF